MLGLGGCLKEVGSAEGMRNENTNRDAVIYNDGVIRRRYLNDNIDISRTSVSGLTDFEVEQNKTITVVPRDSSGNAVGDGCNVYIQVSNQ